MVVFTKPALAAVTAAPAASAALRSFVGDGVSFFNSMRTPAALIAAAAVKDAFALSAVADDVKKSRSWTVLRTVYILLQLLAFSTEMGCVFVATHAIVQLQMSTGVSEIGMSTSLIALMRSPKFEFQYVSVRASFMTGLLAFSTAQALRARQALRRTKELSWCAMWLLLSGVAGLLSYNNSQSITYGGYHGLVKKWIGMTWALLSSRARSAHAPTAILAIGMFALGLVCGARALFRVFCGAADYNADGEVTMDDFVAFASMVARRVRLLMPGGGGAVVSQPSSDSEDGSADPPPQIPTPP